MISLLVNDYCYDCPEFEADVDKETFVSEEPLMYDIEKTVTQTHIGCKHSVRCAGMVEYLKGQLKKKEGKNEQHNEN